jgi:Spy/CpxP family protein refolding chaperone
MKYTITATLLGALLSTANPATAATPVSATASPYVGQESRTIKALSEQQIDDYLNGRGMGTSKAAELNHYPGPRHVLEHAGKLGLSDAQVVKVKAAQDAMVEAASRLGKQIVDKEAELEALYANAQADAQNTKRVVHELAVVQAEFRLVHLNAHLSMREILSSQQIATYDQLRGYASAKSHRPDHPHH